MTAPVPTCREVEPDLLAVAAGEASASGAERVERHLDRCADCRQDLERYRALEALVGALRRAPLRGEDPALARAELESRLADLRRRLVSFGVFPSPLGPILIARSELGVSLVRYVAGRESVASQITHLVGEEAVEDPAATEALHRELLDYLEGRRTQLAWPLDLRRVRSDFQRRVLELTAGLPYGAVTSYAGIARRLGAPRAVRPVAQALRWNPLPIVIPCHRVIGSSGALVGYAGKRVELKHRLLELEGVHAHPAGADFKIRREAMYALHAGDSEYCLPTCGSLASLPLARLVLFGSRERAEQAGLAPCTTCRPDLHPLPA